MICRACALVEVALRIRAYPHPYSTAAALRAELREAYKSTRLDYSVGRPGSSTCVITAETLMTSTCRDHPLQGERLSLEKVRGAVARGKAKALPNRSGR